MTWQPTDPTHDRAPIVRGVCTIPPPGWRCTRGRGHDGPCAAWPDGTRDVPDRPDAALDPGSPDDPHLTPLAMLTVALLVLWLGGVSLGLGGSTIHLVLVVVLVLVWIQVRQRRTDV
jgi:hypothetical protein